MEGGWWLGVENVQFLVFLPLVPLGLSGNGLHLSLEHPSGNTRPPPEYSAELSLTDYCVLGDLHVALISLI